MRILLILALILIPISANAAGLLSQYLSTSATAITSGGTVLGMVYSMEGSSGVLEFRRSATPISPVTAGSPVRHRISAAVAGTYSMIFPEPGLEFRGGLYITMTGVDNITVFYK